MQIELQFHGRDVLLPMANQRAIQGMLYQLLSCAPDYSTFLHDMGYRLNNKVFRLFTFGSLIGYYQRRGKQLLYPEGFWLEVRSCDPRFIQGVLLGTTQVMECSLCDNFLDVVSVRLIDRRIFTDTVKVKMCSPITVHTTEPNGFTHYYTPEDDEFYALIAANAADKWRAFYRSEPTCELKISSCGGTHRKTVTTYKGNYITGYSGEFCLSGNAQMLDLLYNTGLGSKNAQGFGMFDVLPD